MKKIRSLFLLAAMLLTASACSSATSAESTLPTPVISDGNSTVSNTSVESSSIITSISITDEDDVDSDADASYIYLQGDAISFEGSGATVEGSTVTITAAGTYSVSGTLNKGQILVNSTDAEKVNIILNGATITNTSSAPIFILNAEKTVISLASGTVNTLTDGSTYVYADAQTTEPNAAIFSNDDLTINGEGALVVNANYNNGIASDDDLKITGGTLTVTAVNDGIKGKSSLTVKGGVITVNAGSDGLQSQDDEDPEKGTISIEGGTLYINAGLDGIQAETSLVISDGNISITSGGGSAYGSATGNWGNRGGMLQPGGNTTTASTVESTKGLKAGVSVTVAGGVITIDSADDSINSNDSVIIDGGEILITSGDDGIHADATLTINGGSLTITKSYEGIESALITINGGTTHITASDDGINVAGGNDGSAINGRPGQNPFSTGIGNYYLYLNDGYVYINAGGDGLDSNGSIEMNAGTVLVNGPTDNGNGPLDYMGTFNIHGGTLVAVGSSGMAQTPSTSSTQYSVLVNFSSMASAAMFHFETAEGQQIITFVPAKEYQSILISTPQITNGSTLVLYYGGSSTGSVLDGLYTGGTYTAGTQITSLDITGIVTGLGSGGGMMPGGGGRGR